MILHGWKEIANYLRCGVRTVQRWERFGCPIRRPAGRPRSTVIASSEEIDQWLRQCRLGASDGDGWQGNDAKLKRTFVQIIAAQYRVLLELNSLIHDLEETRREIASARVKLRPPNQARRRVHPSALDDTALPAPRGAPRSN
ncbi:MAG TPA: hypothetical protein VFI82_17510 [Terriglobales bacterium]|nr:hypothetical protein [Terriglobales bacterium]